MDKDYLRVLAGTLSKSAYNATKKTIPLVETSLPESTESYEGSHEFDGDIAQIKSLLKKARSILQSPKMQTHIKDTKDNYGIDTKINIDAILNAFNRVDYAIEIFYATMGKAH